MIAAWARIFFKATVKPLPNRSCFRGIVYLQEKCGISLTNCAYSDPAFGKHIVSSNAANRPGHGLSDRRVHRMPRTVSIRRPKSVYSSRQPRGRGLSDRDHLFYV